MTAPRYLLLAVGPWLDVIGSSASSHFKASSAGLGADRKLVCYSDNFDSIAGVDSEVNLVDCRIEAIVMRPERVQYLPDDPVFFVIIKRLLWLNASRHANR